MVKQRILQAAGFTAFSCLLAFSSSVSAKKADVAGPTIEMSESFRTNAQAAKTALQAGDSATAAARITALTPSNDFESYSAAGLRFELATQRRDVQAQRVALTDMFKTNSVPAADAPRLRFLAAYYSYVVGNNDDALAQLGYAKTLGYAGVDATLLKADIALRKGQPKVARPLVQEAIAEQKASGKAVPAAWYDRGISLAYGAGDKVELGQLYRERLALYPSTGEWRSAISNYLAASGDDVQTQLDLYRLQAANGALASERDYQAYATLAAKAGYNAEAKSVIDAGRTNGKLIAQNAVINKLLVTVTPKARTEIAALPASVTKAAAAKSGAQAMAVGDSYFSLAQYPQAAEQYRIALTKGDVDANRVNSRLGVALARSGDLNGAKQALTQVSGDWSIVAGFWSVWVDQQGKKVNAALASQPTGV